jgi:hypothetical protein
MDRSTGQHMKCPHCNMPARLDYPLEYTCASYIHVGLFTRSPICFGNEIAQLKAKLARIEAAGDKLAARYMSSLPQGGKAAQHVREYHREKEQP